MIVRPVGISLQDWADSVALDLGIYGVVGKITDDDWQSWAIQLCNNVGIGKNIPNPYQFEQWDEWAQRLCEVFA